MTKDILKQYRYLSEVIRKDEEKLQYYKDNPPEAYLGKVQSSNKQFPYQRISVTVSGCEVKDRKYWKDKQYQGNCMVVRDFLMIILSITISKDIHILGVSRCVGVVIQSVRHYRRQWYAQTCPNFV